MASYSDTGFRFRHKLEPADVEVWHKRDTTIDSIEYEIWNKMISKDVDWRSISEYRLLENWTFDPSEFKTTVRVEGLSPDLRKYVLRYNLSNYSNLANYSQLFWVRYSDISDILYNYDTWHPLNNFSTNLWNSYFLPQPVR